MQAKVITPEQFKANLRSQGKTLGQWCEENGYGYHIASRVLNGQSKATFGISHNCAVKMGIKADPTLVTQE